MSWFDALTTLLLDAVVLLAIAGGALLLCWLTGMIR